MIKDYEGRKSVMVIASQPGMSYFIIPTVLKNKSKVMEAIKESTLLKAMRF